MRKYCILLGKDETCFFLAVRRQTGKRNRNILQLDKNTYGGWSMCDVARKNHMRFKQCVTLNPNKCQMDSNVCDPAKGKLLDLLHCPGSRS